MCKRLWQIDPSKRNWIFRKDGKSIDNKFERLKIAKPLKSIGIIKNGVVGLREWFYAK
jgi:hypothetical protein